MSPRNINKSLRRGILGVLYLLIFFSFASGASAHNHCPDKESPQWVAEEYKLISAYQIAFDGYQPLCENICFKKSNCINECQSNKGLKALKQAMNQYPTHWTQNCAPLKEVCYKTCQEGNKKGCQKTCLGKEQFAVNL